MVAVLMIAGCDSVRKFPDGNTYVAIRKFHIYDGREPDHPHSKVTGANLVFSENEHVTVGWDVKYTVPVGAEIKIINRIDYNQAMVGKWILLECEYPKEKLKFYYATSYETDLKKLPWELKKS